MTSPRRPPRLLMITGEASGDRYGGLLAEELRQRIEGIRISGVGGERMREAGVEILYDADAISVTGLLEVFGALGPILTAWRTARHHLRRERPDAVVLIDYPDFNLSFARFARRQGVPVLYFVAPQVWAWRQYRVRRIGRDVDRMLVILPFEEEFFRERGVSVRFVGHPLVDLVEAVDRREDAAGALGLPRSPPILGLLPGSRANEIQAVLGPMLDAAAQLRGTLPTLQAVLPVSSGRHRRTLEEGIRDARVPVTLVQDAFPTAVRACHAVLASSGTATLEVALMGVPEVITYKVSPWTYRMARKLSSLERAGLPNLILDRSVVPECIQDECRGDRLAEAVAPLLQETEVRAEMLREFQRLRVALGGGGAISRAADGVIELLRETGALRAES